MTLDEARTFPTAAERAAQAGPLRCVRCGRGIPDMPGIPASVGVVCNGCRSDVVFDADAARAAVLNTTTTAMAADRQYRAKVAAAKVAAAKKREATAKEAAPCINCGKMVAIRHSGECKACYRYWLRRKVRRPERLWRK